MSVAADWWSELPDDDPGFRLESPGTILPVRLAPGAQARDYGLRWYQGAGKVAVESSLEVNRSCLTVMATGLGKTRLGGAIAGDWPGNVLWLAHRDELIQQARDDLERITGEMVEIEQGQLRASSRSRIVVGSVDTVKRQNRLDRFGAERFSLVITDEAHHYTAATYRRPLEFFKNAKLLGLTATPDRGDEKALGQIFDDVAFVFDIQQGIEQGYLVPIRAHTVEVKELDISGVKTQAGDLVAAQLDEVMLKACAGIVKETLRYEPVRQGIVFLPGVKSAELAAQLFNREKPGSAAFVSGMTDKDERRDIVRAFRDGRVQYLCNCQIATEGFDAPGCSMIVQGRPTKSRALAAQMAGRGTRVLPGIVDHLDGEARAPERREAIAGSAKPDCIAEGHFVLTDRGPVPIERVTTEMRVWDGASWVTHCGAILRGEREVIDYAGISATEDHFVWTETGWQAFGRCAREQIPIAVTGFGGYAIRQTEGLYRGGDPAERETVHPRAMRILRDAVEQGTSFAGLGEGGVSVVRASSAGSEVAREPVLGGSGALHEPETPGLLQVRGQGDPVPLFLANGDGCLDPGEPGGRARSPDRPHRERQALRAGESSLVDQATEHVPYLQAEPCHAYSPVSSGASGDPLRGCDAAALGGALHVRGDRGPVPTPLVKTKRRVWDILGAGPLHRFTVEGLLVHNCVILDFVGNCGRHTLVTPADILGGNYTEAEVTLAKKRQKGGGDVLKALQEARAELKRIAEKAAIKASSVRREVDPFQVFHMQRDDSQRFGHQPMTPGQFEYLDRMGVPAEQLNTLSKADASKLIAAAKIRRDKELCTFKQLRLLQQNGVTDVNVGFRKASEALDYIFSERRGGRKPDPAQIDSIIHRPREPGEES